MAGTQAVWGIDLGRCALKAIKLRAAEDKVEVLAVDWIEHAKILTQPDADRNELISSALEKLLSRNDLSKDSVVVSVSGQHTLARFTKLPPVAPKRIPDIVRYEADQQIPFDMDEVIWDYQTFQQEDLPDIEVGIFAMKRELIREHLLHFEQASIEPIAVQSGPLAVYNAAHYDGWLGSETTILLDIGAENTDLIIATPVTFWTRTVPIGGNNFTEALVKSFKLSFSKAENLKRSADSSKYARQIFQAMRPVFADLVQELQRSMGFYSSTHRDTKVEKVVCVGNGAKLPGLTKYLQQNLGLPVERPDALKKATLAGTINVPEFKENILGFGVAYGLALQGLDHAKVTSNLLPTEIAKQIVWQRKRPAFAAAAACVVLAGALMWFRLSADMRALAAGSQVPPAPSNLEAAWTVIEKDPSPPLSDRAQAEAVRAAGDFLKNTLQKLKNEGTNERTETESLVAMQRYKSIVPMVLGIIHESAPRGDEVLAGVTSTEEFINLIKEGKAPPRSQRKRVFIERLGMQWEPDLNRLVWESRVPVPKPINDPESVVPGFKVEIACRTSYQGEEGSAIGGATQSIAKPTEFIDREFMTALRENGRRPGLGFYFDRVFLFDGRKIEVGPGGGGGARGTTTPSASGPRGRGLGLGPLGRTTTPAQPTIVHDVNPEAMDPITNEPIEGDSAFVIWVDVILGDLPEDVATGTEDAGG